jgi:hypothetical protein
MKSGEIKKVVQSFKGFFPSDWVCLKDSFGRRKGPWIQFIAFKPSRFSDEYEPGSCFDFLWEPGGMSGGFLGQGLLHKRHPVQRWVSLKEHYKSPEAIYRDMVEQFTPRIDQPLDTAKVEQLLQADTVYWPHLYALFILTCELGRHDQAAHYYKKITQLLMESPYDWALERRRELARVHELARDPAALQAHLREIELKKLTEAKLLTVLG